MYILPVTVQKETGLALPIRDSIKPIYIDGRKSARDIYTDIVHSLSQYDTTIYVASKTIDGISQAIALQRLSFL